MKNFYWSVVNFLATTKHKFWVFFFLLKICLALIKRGIRHDLSKYSKEEAPMFAGNLRNLKKIKYGTPAYEEQLVKLQTALKHHYSLNSHHPQFYQRKYYGMSLLDRLEMLADWKAAGKRTEDGSLSKSLYENKHVFHINNKEMKILEKDCKEAGLL